MRNTVKNIALAALLAAAPVFASTGMTDPAGFTRQPIQPGRQTIGITLNHEIIASARIVANEARAVLLDPSSASLATLLADGSAYYVEIAGDVESTFSGDRFDIDVAATRASNGTLLFFKAAAHNSTTRALPANGLAGHRAIIRRHLTLADVFGTGTNSALQAAATHENADTVLFHDRTTGAYVTFFLAATSSGTSEWRKLGASGSMNETIIPPATGLFVNRRASTSTELMQLGTVRTNDFVLPLQAGYNLVCSPYPVALLASRATIGLQMSSANGFVAASDPAAADEILVFNGAGYESYYLRAGAQDGSEIWQRLGASDQEVTNALLLSHDRSVLIKKVAADPDFIVRRTFAL